MIGWKLLSLFCDITDWTHMYCSSAHSTIFYTSTEKESGFILRIRSSVFQCLAVEGVWYFRLAGAQGSLATRSALADFLKRLETGDESESHEWFTEPQTLADPALLQLNSWARWTRGHFMPLLFSFTIKCRLCALTITKRTTKKALVYWHAETWK